MSFDAIIGHDFIKERLLNAVKLNRVSHAYVFCGNKGIGKTTTALEFAKILTAQKQVDEQAGGQAGGQASGQASGQADIIFVTNEHYNVKDKAALSVDTVRAARVDMFTKPYLADKKVFIFPNAETMTVGAQNALLKVFEEPPSYCVIILIAQNENMMLPTIRSRAMTIRFTPLEDRLIRQYLLQKYNVGDDILVRLCAGSIASADLLMQEDGIKELVDGFYPIFRRFTTSDMGCVYEAIAVFEREKSRYNVLLDLISAIAHDSVGYMQTEGLLKVENFKPSAALQIVDMVVRARKALQSNRNYNIVVSELLIEAWRLIHD